MKDYYKILGVDRNVSEKEIKKSFREKSLKYHPDKQTGKTDQEKKEAEEKFKEIAEAYDVLSNKEKRQEYDMFGTTGHSTFNSSHFNANDIFEQFIKEQMRGFEMHQEPSVPNIVLQVYVTLEELYNNSKKTISYKANRKCTSCNGSGSKDGKNGKTVCEYCHGSGYITQTQTFGYSTISNIIKCPHCNGKGYTLSNPCNKCNGKGYERKDVSLDIDLVNGITHNCGYTIAQNGNYIPNTDNSYTDLILKFNVLFNSTYKVSKENYYDIEMAMDVPILDCITGAAISFKYIDGNTHKVEIKPCTKNGEKILVNSLGLRDRTGKRGNLIININYKLPKEISNEEKKAFEKIKKMKNFK